MKLKRTICLICAFLLLISSATALAAGKKCPNCGGSMKKTAAPAGREATCTERGVSCYVCTSCKFTITYDADPLGHDYRVRSRQESTCTEPGFEKRVCARCNKTDKKTLPASGHMYTQTVTEPTCTQDGAVVYTCSLCGDSYFEPVAASGHTYTETVTEPTCTEAGIVCRVCSVCGDNYVTESKPLGHDYRVENKKEATCTEDGVTPYICSVCGDVYSETVPAFGHSYIETVTEPTCTADGTKVYTCSVCGDSYSEPVPAFGHSYTETVTEPTCTADGTKVYTCSVCNDSYSEPVPASGHRFGSWETTEEAGIFKEGKQKCVCGVCGEEETETLPRKKGGAALVIGIAAILGGIFFGLRKHAAAKKKLGVPSVKMKKILFCLKPTVENAMFEETLKNKLCFKLIKVPYGEADVLKKAVAEHRPDITVISASSSREAETLIKSIREAAPEQTVSVLGEQGMDEGSLKRLKIKKSAVSTALCSDPAQKKLVRLAMAVYRPDVAGDDYLGVLSSVTDALGLGFVSKLITAYGVKSDISDILEHHGPDDVSGAASVLNDIASLFGCEAAADLADKVRLAADQLFRGKELKDR